MSVKIAVNSPWFHHMDLDATDGDKWKVRKWELGELERVLRIWQQHMLGNHGKGTRASP
jgi:hypothetical protein